MAFIEIPVQAVPYQRFSIQIDGAAYHLRVSHNTRAGTWSIDIYDAVQTPLVCGMAMRLGLDLLSQFSDDRFPPGRMFLQNLKEAYAEPDRENLGTDVVLIYQEAA